MNRVREWSRLPAKAKRRLQLILIERDGSKCYHCGVQTVLGSGRPDQTTIDHWPVPKRNLPRREWLLPRHCVIACLGCNARLDHEARTGGRKCEKVAT